MPENALQYLQSAHNEVGIAARSWTGWANALAPEYDGARDGYVDAVKGVAEAIKLKKEQMWTLLTYMLGTFGAPWAGRLLAPAKRLLTSVGTHAQAINDFDDLTSAFFKDAVEKMAGTAKDALKDSVLDFVKKKATGSTNDPFTPTVEKTENWKSRLLESIEFRAKDLEIATNEQVRNQHKWSVPAAASYEQSMLNNCPFIADQPSEPGADERAAFRKKAELNMWIEWGNSLSEDWIRKVPPDDLWDMTPILTRLLLLGVPHYDIASYAMRGTSIASARRGHILDLKKFASWARIRRLAEKAVKDGLFANPNVCTPAQAHFGTLAPL
jgi:hypothetical protein